MASQVWALTGGYFTTSSASVAHNANETGVTGVTGTVRLGIRDDGVGLRETAHKPAGIGLATMAYRASCR